MLKCTILYAGKDSSQERAGLIIKTRFGYLQYTTPHYSADQHSPTELETAQRITAR